MKLSAVISLLLSFVLLASVPAGYAMETDQYNLPPVPLFDIGEEVSDHIAENLSIVIGKVNAEIEVHETCLYEPNKELKCGTMQAEREKLEYLRSNDAVAFAVFRLLGDGDLFITKTGKWFHKHQFSHEPARYTTSYAESIYLTQPTDYIGISPTVRLYGSQFGTDKIEHFLQQGYSYYKIYNHEIKVGSTSDEAVKKAVKWGKTTEKTYFGLLVSGVYSNGDLVANYAGMKFYQGLTQPIQIGSIIRPAILILKDGMWVINDHADLHEDLLKPFVSDHLNEALNPSVYAFNIYPFVRSIVKKQSCPQWRKMYPDLSKNDITAQTAALTLWNGVDYGYLKRDKMVSIADSCFANETAAK